MLSIGVKKTLNVPGSRLSRKEYAHSLTETGPFPRQENRYPDNRNMILKREKSGAIRWALRNAWSGSSV